MSPSPSSQIWEAVDFLLYPNIITTLRTASSGLFPEEKHLLLSQESVSRKHNPAVLKWQATPGSPRLALSAGAQIYICVCVSTYITPPATEEVGRDLVTTKNKE